jgi:endonuclease III
MHFTVVFEGPESEDLSFGLVFLPVPVWVLGDRELLNLHPERPQLQPGAVRRLLALPEVAQRPIPTGTTATVVVHPTGDGTEDDLNTLEQDLRDAGFFVRLSRAPQPHRASDNHEAILRELRDMGRRLFAENRQPLVSGDPLADRLVNDLEHYPHAFVLACIANRQVKAEVAWRIPHVIATAVGGFDMARLEALSEADLLRALTDGRSAHRYPQMMAGFLHRGIARLKTEYGGDASCIWEGRPSSAEVVRRFQEFDGVGQKIGTMAANILARDFRVPMADLNSIDVSVDIHVSRVFARLGLVDLAPEPEDIIAVARRANPEYPGLIDLPVWNIGTEWCHKERPRCTECPMRHVCANPR